MEFISFGEATERLNITYLTLVKLIKETGTDTKKDHGIAFVHHSLFDRIQRIGKRWVPVVEK